MFQLRIYARMPDTNGFELLDASVYSDSWEDLCKLGERCGLTYVVMNVNTYMPMGLWSEDE